MLKETININPEIKSAKENFKALFDQIINKPIIKEVDDLITTKNNRLLLIDKDENIFSIESFDSDEKFYLKSRVESNGDAIFNLKTKSEKYPFQKHPDLYAAEFIKLSLEYFQKNNIQIKKCMDFWGKQSNNYNLFMENLKEHRNDKVVAAKSTWSGQQFIKNGFTQINKDDINYSCFMGCVIACFHKPY